MDINMVTTDVHRGVLQEIRDSGNVHRCDRFCKFRHVFGNLFECQTSGKNHICDQNCKELIYYDSTTTICRLSKKLFERQPDPALLSNRRRRREDYMSLESSKRMCHH